MKRQLPAFLFLVFFFSQFGKVVNFCLCTIDTYRQTGSIACDCEKQLSADVATETKKQNHQHAVAMSQADELFHINITNDHAFLPFSIIAKRYGSLHEPLYDEWSCCIFHPPGIL